MTEPGQRAGVLWLPVLGELVIDARSWEYGNDRHGPRGVARLRVWDVPAEHGCYAIVTETGAGLSVTSAAAAIYKAVLHEFGTPLGMAELWPEGHSGPAHLDAVVPAAYLPHGVSWYRLWPCGIGGTVPGFRPDMASAWMSVNAAEIFAP